MEGTAVLGGLSWRLARLASVVDETPRVRSLFLDCPGWPGHLAGQHVDVRLTAEDGYQAQRSYSLASGPEDKQLELTVERLTEGEVSTYLCDVLQPGEELELRGPIGRYFAWTEALGGPLLLIGGGSGVVPLRSMIRHHVAVGSQVPVRLLYSSRSSTDIIYRREFDQLSQSGRIDVRFTLTREWPERWAGYRRRIDSAMLREVAWPVSDNPLVYVCGPAAFVETVANNLVELGHEPDRIRTERFGPSGS